MSTIPTWLSAIAWITVALMFVNGVLFFTKRDLGLKLTGHTVEGAVTIVGARFFFFAALGGGYLLFQEYSALAFLLAVGVFVAIGDIFLEKKYGGDVLPHIGVATICAVLSYLFYTLPMTGVS